MQPPFENRSRWHVTTSFRVVTAVLCCLFFASPAGAVGSQQLRGHVPTAVARLTPVERMDGTKRLGLAIGLPLRNQTGLTQLLKQIYDPANPNYRHFLTTSQFTAQFGPTQQDYDAVAAFATAHGLTVTYRHPNRLVLDVSGSVSDIEKALNVRMHVYRHPTENRTFYAPDTDPSLDLSVPVSHISGLDNYAPPRPRFKPMPAPSTVVATSATPRVGTAPNGSSYMGYDFRAAYAPGVTLTGSGQTVGLLQFDGYKASDITYYENLAGLPNVKLTNVLLDGFNGHPTNTDGPVEVSLDIEMSISMAPGLSQVIVYEAGPNGLWHDILNRMASDNLAKQLSCSWYIPGGTEDTYADGIFQEMAAQGQSFFSASGDSDAFTGLIPFPGDTPYITEVGGTTLTDSGNGGPWSSETVWNWGNGTGSGGGISTQYSIPSWQQNINMTASQGSTTMRNVPDVALTADNVYVRQGGANQYVGGTSCAAPLWAGFAALVNQQAAANGFNPIGFINPAVYALAAGSGYGLAFHDITTGNNTSASSPNEFYAVPGYDLCTGLGTPTGAALINALAVAPDNLQLSSTAALGASGAAGGPFNPNSDTYTLANTGNSQLTWAASATQSWLSLSGTSGTLAASGSTTVIASINSNANTLATGTYSDTITVVDTTTGYTQTRPVSLAVLGVPVIDSALTTTATAGNAFSYQIAATSNPTSFGASGLPTGLSVNTSSGLISGTATTSGTSNVTITASNIAGTGTAALRISVLPAPPVITSPLTATGISGVTFGYQISASNNPTSFGATGLPSGLSINATSGAIGGDTTQTGTTNVIISASNPGGTGVATLVLTIQPPAPVITSALTGTAPNGSAYSYQIAATNSPTKYGASGLPTGLIVNTSSGLISGTTTATGTSNVTISAANVTGTGTATLTLTVLPPVPAITSSLSASATVGSSFSYSITASNNPTSYNATGLPSGLSINTSSGQITGTPTQAGSTNVTISASNAGGTGNATLTITVQSLGKPVITSSLSKTGLIGAAFSYQITATNSPNGFGASGLPSGLGVNSSTGLISGTPATTGTSDITIIAANSNGPGVATLTLVVQATYSAWENMVFTPTNLANPAVSGATADPAGDGIPNLMKYALYLNPFTDGIGGLPAGVIVATGSGNYLTLTYNQVISATDISYNVQVSSDLKTWHSGPGYTSTLGVTSNSNGVTESVTVEDVTPIAPGIPKQFIRLQVTQP